MKLMRVGWLRLMLVLALIVAGIGPWAAAPEVQAAGAVYYVDAAGGNDSDAGTSAGTAWQTLAKVNATVFQPGDAILFKADGVWTGTLSPQGSGVQGQPITIDMYGSGRKPLIAGAGAAAAVYFYNQEQWEVRNMEITNDAATKGVRRGIHVDGSSGTWSNPKVYRHFVFENLDIHHVKGNVSTDYAHNGGIIVWGTNWDYHVADVVVKNSKIYTVDSVGIYIYGAQKAYSSGFRVADNVIYDIGADGAFILDTTGGVIENNVVYDTHLRASGYHVPLWVFSSKNSVIQFNEVYNTAPGGDAMAYDADYRSDGTIIQYNYSHNNAGGAFLVVNDGTVSTNANTNTTIRYNISQNDGGAVFNFSGTPDTTTIYNNTVYMPRSSTAKVVDVLNWGGYAKNTYYYNNLIYNLGSGGYNFAGSTNNVFDYNLFYGNHPAGEPADAHKQTAEPQLASPGSGGIGKHTLAGYQLLNTSPAIGAGKIIVNNGGRDFFGNPVAAGTAPNIGAYQGPGLDPNNLPPLPQPPQEENLLKNAGFEAGDFTNWPTHYNGATVETSNAYEGAYSAKLTGAYAGAEQTVSGLYPNTIYKLYAYGKSTGGGDAVIGVKNYGGTAKDVHVSSSAYTKKELTFTTGSDANSATIYLYKAGGGGDVWFDALELIQFSAAPGGPSGPVYTVGVSDEFNGLALNSQWHWVRENSANWSLSANAGSMRIVSEAGDIVDGGATARNILLTGAPEGNWMIETKMSGKPSARWAQGGLIAYVDDSTYFRMTRLYGSGNQFQFTKQVNAMREHVEVADTIQSAVSYMRILKYGNTYSGYYSEDGVTYTQVWTTQTADLANLKIGLIVCAGTGLTADFDYFRIVTDGLTPPSSPSPTPTPTVTPTPTPTATPTATPTPTPSATPTPTATPSATPTPTPTATPTATPTPTPVAVTGVVLNKNNLLLQEGQSFTLTATVAPANASNKTLLWSSDNPTSVTVNVYGVVTAAGPGTAVVTATTADGAKTAVCTVKVVAAVNLLANPGFETGDFTGWPTHFTQSAIVNSNARTGDYAARLTTAYGGIEQYISGLAPNTTYVLKGWAKGTNGEFGVRNYGSYQRQVYVNAADYTQGEITFTTGSTNTTVTVFMYKRAAAGEVYFDDLELMIKTPQ